MSSELFNNAIARITPEQRTAMVNKLERLHNETKMKNLTKQHRHLLYKESLRIFYEQAHVGVFLCVLFGEIMMYEHSTYDLTEFMRFKPDNIDEDASWFSKFGSDYTEKYIKEHQELVLLFCIEMSKE